MSKKTKYMDSIGNGLLSNDKKYADGTSEAIEMKEINNSSRYNYANLD